MHDLSPGINREQPPLTQASPKESHISFMLLAWNVSRTTLQIKWFWSLLPLFELQSPAEYLV